MARAVVYKSGKFMIVFAIMLGICLSLAKLWPMTYMTVGTGFTIYCIMSNMRKRQWSGVCVFTLLLVMFIWAITQ